MNKGLLILIVLVLGLVGCKSNEIEVYEEGTEITTRKFGPSDLEKLGTKLMEKLDASDEEWIADTPRLAIIDFRNDTDMPGLNKQPFFDVVETAMFRMKKFDLIDYQNTKIWAIYAGTGTESRGYFRSFERTFGRKTTPNPEVYRQSR